MTSVTRVSSDRATTRDTYRRNTSLLHLFRLGKEAEKIGISVGIYFRKVSRALTETEEAARRRRDKIYMFGEGQGRTRGKRGQVQRRTDGCKRRKRRDGRMIIGRERAERDGCARDARVIETNSILRISPGRDEDTRFGSAGIRGILNPRKL